MPALPASFLESIARARRIVREGETYVQNPLSPLPPASDGPGRARVTLIGAPCGRGKSQLLKRVVKAGFPEHASILSVTPRVSLAVAQSALLKGMGFSLYHTMKNVKDELSSSKRCICQYESLHHMDDAALNRQWDLVVCDEIRSTLCSVSSSATNRSHLVANADALTRVLSLAQCVLLMDADLDSDGAVARMVRYVLKEPPERVRYELYPPLPRSGGRKDRALVLTVDEVGFWDSISRAMRNGERVAVVCALRKQALGYAEACVASGLARPSEIGCYTSDMSESAVSRVFTNFDAATQDKRFVVFTSKVSVGIDASETRPHRIFMDFRRPVQVARVALQMLYRFRRPFDGRTLCLVPDEVQSGICFDDIVRQEEVEIKGLVDEMQTRCRTLASCEAATGASRRPAPPALLTHSIASTRAERRRDFVGDLKRCARNKGIKVVRAPRGPKLERSAVPSAKNLRTALSCVRDRDQKFASTVAISVLRASQARGGLKRIAGAQRSPGSATRESRALDSGSAALLHHPGVGSAGGLLGRPGSWEWVKLWLGSRLRDSARCNIASGDGSEVRRASFDMPASPRSVKNQCAACTHVYYEAVAAHSTGRSRRISALQRSASALGANGGSGPRSPAMLSCLSDVTKKLVRYDIASRNEYGSAAVSKSEVGAFRACHGILRLCLGAKGGLIDIARGAACAGGRAAALSAVPLDLARLYADSPEGAGVRRSCVALAGEALMLCQNVLSGRGYGAASRFDGTRGGPRVGSRADIVTDAEKALRLASEALFFVYGILLVPRKSLQCAMKRAVSGSWNIEGYRPALASACAYVAVVDPVRWSLANAFVPDVK